MTAREARQTSERLVWLDWLKALVVLGVIAFHAAQPFVQGDWIIASDERSIVLGALAGAGYLFAMPLLFVLSGVASWIALVRRPVAVYVRVRVLRLGMPLLVGILLLAPFESWVGQLSLGARGSLPEFVAQYYAELTFSPDPLWLAERSHHLWFLGFLLVFALVTLPPTLWLRSRCLTLPSAYSGAMIACGAVAGVVISQWLLRVPFPAYRDWADALLWLAYFLLGLEMAAQPRLLDIVARRWRVWFAGAGLLLVVYVPLATSGRVFELEMSPRLDAAGLGYAALRTLTGLTLVLASLALGVRWLRGWPTVAMRAGNASLAAYVIHHPIVVVVAALAITLPIGLWPTFFLVLGVSLAATVLAYELVVRRVAMLRTVFGA